MCVEVSFEPVDVATYEGPEDGYLVYANRQLVALLVPADDGWFLQMGFGRCAQEGLIFGHLDEVKVWINNAYLIANGKDIHRSL